MLLRIERGGAMECHDHHVCVLSVLKNIVTQQKNAGRHCKESCKHSFNKPLDYAHHHWKNTIPFVLYNQNGAFQVDGVATCVDQCSHKERFICFTTFIFKVIEVKENCAVLELLKFKHHTKGDSCSVGAECTPCCQIHCEEVDDLIATGVCITIDVSTFTSIQCLKAVHL